MNWSQIKFDARLKIGFGYCNRWKTPQPNFLLASYKRGVFAPKKEKRLQPFRILIRSSNWLGDSVMSIPAVRAIKAGRPDAQVTIATPENLASVWKLVPEVDQIIQLPNKSLFRAISLVRQKQPFDVAILFPNSLRAALEARLANIKRRIGYRGHWRSVLLNQIVREPRKPGPLKHQTNRYLRIAEECGAETLKTKRLTLAHPRLSSSRQILLGLCPGAKLRTGQTVVAGSFRGSGEGNHKPNIRRNGLFSALNEMLKPAIRSQTCSPISASIESVRPHSNN